ncbi:MAG: BrnT family toxin [Bryobacteraceae bacterium]
MTVIRASNLIDLKSQAAKRRHGVSLKEVQQVFDQTYLVDQKDDDPEQFRAIGWCRGRLCSVIFEIRYDEEGEYYHLVTAWKATKEEEQSYAKNA